jgi:hypothetical protein
MHIKEELELKKHKGSKCEHSSQTILTKRKQKPRLSPWAFKLYLDLQKFQSNHIGFSMILNLQFDLAKC